MTVECDYCPNIAEFRLIIHNKFWSLCLECVLKNKERFSLSDDQIKKARLAC